MKRRTFVRKTALAAAALPFIRADEVKLPFEVEIHAPRRERSPMGMPGLFPARVVEVRDERSIVESRISEEAVRRMVERGMKELTGARTARDAWRRFLQLRRDGVAPDGRREGEARTIRRPDWDVLAPLHGHTSHIPGGTRKASDRPVRSTQTIDQRSCGNTPPVT